MMDLHFDMSLTSILVLVFQVYLYLTVFYLLLDNRDPSETFAWIFVFLLMPGIGFVIYLTVGYNGRRRYDRLRKLPQNIAKNLLSLFTPLGEAQERMMKSIKGRRQCYQDELMTLLFRNSKSLLTLNNEVEFFHHGRDKFDALIEDIKNAKRFIHMEYFIWNSKGALGKKLKELLIQKASEGVEIRILYDYSGCYFTLSRRYRRELRKAGIKIYPFFNYLSEMKLHTLNHRNHRKIVVIDGEIGYTGGMNVAQEYIDGGKRFNSWRDTHFRLTGGAVSLLQAIFSIDWFNTAHEEGCFDAKYFPGIPESAQGKGAMPIQLTTSGYDTEWPALLQLYFTMITTAQKNIFIVSPYFVPDNSLLVALKTAALRGLEVVVIMTGVADNPLPYWAAYSYFDEILKSGVRIFQYQKGFMHAKMISIDGKICSAGTTNFDMRSLRLNYELNAVFYDEATTRAMDAQIAEDLKDCREVLSSDMNKITLIGRLRNSLARLLANIL